MSSKAIQTAVHALAILTGILGILAAAAPQIGIPPYAVAVVGVVITVLTYVANQLPALGTDAPAPAQPTALVTPPAPAPTA